MQVSHYLSRIGVFGIIVRGRTDKKIGQENLGDFFFLVSDRGQKKGRIIKMYKLIDLIGMIDCLVDFWQMPMPNAQSNRYPYPFPLNIYSSLSLNDHA